MGANTAACSTAPAPYLVPRTALPMLSPTPIIAAASPAVVQMHGGFLYPRQGEDDKDNKDDKPQQPPPTQTCPEQAGLKAQECSACGGQSKVAGFCDKILRSGPQDEDGCRDSGCGVYCRCTGSGEPKVPDGTPFKVSG